MECGTDEDSPQSNSFCVALPGDRYGFLVVAGTTGGRLVLRQKALNTVIDDIYQASIVGDWQRVLRPVLELTGSSAGAYLGIHKPSSEIAFCEVLDIPEPMLREYDAEFVRRDPRVVYAIEHPETYINHDAQHMTERRLWKSEYFEWLAGYRFRYYLSLQLLDEVDLTCHCSIQRHPGDGPASPEQLRAAKLLLPHMRRGLMLYRAVLQQHGIATTALDLLETKSDPVFLCAPDGRIVWRNQAAAKCLNTPEVPLMENDGCLQPRVRQQLASWRNWLAQAARAAEDPLANIQPHFALQRTETDTPTNIGTRVSCRATVHPLPSPAILFPDLRAPRLAITLQPTRRDATVDSAMLHELFGLTAREADLALQITHGRTVAEAARALGITNETARGYLKRVLHKTSTRRQAELVGLLGTLGIVAFTGGGRPEEKDGGSPQRV